jgi:hypothetical protein
MGGNPYVAPGTEGINQSYGTYTNPASIGPVGIPIPQSSGFNFTNPAPIGGTNGFNTNPLPSNQKQSQPKQQGETDVQSWDRQWREAGNQGPRPEGYHGSGGQPSGPSEADLNAVYDPSMNYLNQAESTARSGYADVLSQAESDYQALVSELSGNKQKNLTTIGENQITTSNVKEDALAAARRLYDQLRRGYQQRFGGATSAGQAASEISSAEQQRQMGGINRDYATTTRQIEQQKTQLETDFQTGMMKLQQGKQQALGQAQSDFQNKLLSISQNRAQVESAKAQARLTALQELRNQAYTINQQSVRFQQTLEAQRQASLLDLQNYTAKFNVAGGAAGTAATNFQPTVSSNLQVQNGNQQTTGPLTGSISKKPEDLTGSIDPNTFPTNTGLTPYAQDLLYKKGMVGTSGF